MKELVYSLENIEVAVEFILANTQSRILLFDGEMGSGKTTLIKALVKKLGSEDEVNSPTFAIVNEYRTSDFPVYHFDLYRLNDFYEALDFGIEEYLSDPKAYILIEWPEVISEILPDNSQKIRIIVNENNTRVLQII